MVEADGSYYRNDKRTAFIPLEDLPRLTSQPMELALNGVENELDELTEKGWRVVNSHAVSSTPEAYRSYVQHSRGEFGWAKLGYQKLQSGWISDRTVYLASGKPVVLQDTGPLAFLPEEAGRLLNSRRSKKPPRTWIGWRATMTSTAVWRAKRLKNTFAPRRWHDGYWKQCYEYFPKTNRCGSSGPCIGRRPAQQQ